MLFLINTFLCVACIILLKFANEIVIIAADPITPMVLMPYGKAILISVAIVSRTPVRLFPVAASSRPLPLTFICFIRAAKPKKVSVCAQRKHTWRTCIYILL